MSTSINRIASDLKKIISESDGKKTSPYDTKATVTRVDESTNTVWVQIPGGDTETPVQRTTNAQIGDSTMVRVSGGRAWLLGNVTNPPTDDTMANAANARAIKADDKAETAIELVDSLNSRVVDASNRLTVVEGDITNLEDRVDTAEDSLTIVEGDIVTLQSNVSTAQNNITTIQGSITALQSDVSTAQGDISDIQGDITTLQGEVSEAQDDIDDTLKGLALAENVIGTLNWLTAHSTLTTDTSPVSGKSYYKKNSDNTFELVTDTTGKNPSQEGWYEMDDAISNYVGAHLSLTDYGLNLVLDNSSYRIHIGTLTASGKDGVYLLDGNGNVVSFFGENINFSSDRPQYIGNRNAYIRFDPANGGSISIGGANITLGDNRTLDDIATAVDNILIYDHSYEYILDENQKKVGATFTAFLYQGGVDIKTKFEPSCFAWYLKKEDTDGRSKEILLGTGYTMTVSLADCGYGAEIIGQCTIADEAEVLDSEGNNLTDSEGDNLTVRATGESVRVRDLTTATIIFPSEKLMVVGASDEHLVSVQTLQDYLNANLDKQVLFDTTANWNAQTSLVSDPTKLYIYTDYKYDSQGNAVAGIKVGDGNAYVVDLPFIDAIATEHIADNTRHITASERTFWNNKVRCYYAGTENLIFTTS